MQNIWGLHKKKTDNKGEKGTNFLPERLTSKSWQLEKSKHCILHSSTRALVAPSISTSPKGKFNCESVCPCVHSSTSEGSPTCSFQRTLGSLRANLRACRCCLVVVMPGHACKNKTCKTACKRSSAMLCGKLPWSTPTEYLCICCVFVRR